MAKSTLGDPEPGSLPQYKTDVRPGYLRGKTQHWRWEVTEGKAPTLVSIASGEAENESKAQSAAYDALARHKAKLSGAQSGESRKRTPDEQRAEIDRVAREHGADLSEDRFNEALRKVGRSK